MKRFLPLVVALCLTVDARSETFTIDMLVGGEVNGEPLTAHASGLGDPATGVMTLDWEVAALPMGYSVWGSVLTQANYVGSNIALTRGISSNLLEAAGGNYSVQEVSTFDDGSQLLADVEVSTSQNVISSVVTLTGDVSLPPLTGVIVSTSMWRPGTDENQFVETVLESLLRRDGGPPIQVQTSATYILGLIDGVVGHLPQRQFREATLTVLEAIPDITFPANARVQYQSTVFIPEPPSIVLAVAGIFGLLARKGRRYLRPARQAVTAAR